MFGKMTKVVLAMMVVLSMTAACGGQPSDGGGGTNGEGGAAEKGGDNSPKMPVVTKDPVELTFYYMYADSNYDQFMKEQGSYIQKKYPNFSFKFIQNTKGTTIEDIIATKTDVDVFITINPSMLTIKEAGLAGDISDLVKKYNFDLNRFDPTALQVVRNIGDGTLPGLPFKMNSLGFFYNKDIFDKFGVPYPKDGWTWDDVYDVAKRLTREDGGVQYRGFGIRALGQTMQLNPYSYKLLDIESRKATIDNEQWKQYLSKLIPLYQVPGYEATSALIQDAKMYDLFVKDKTMAMLVQMNSDYPKSYQNLNINWDAVTFPTFKDRPGVGPQPDIVYYVLSATSKHRDEAFLAMAELTSDEVQLARSRLGNPPVLKSSAFRDVFGADDPDLNGKNKKALVPEKYAEPTLYSKYNVKVVAPLAGAFRSVVLGQKDANTALREAEEKANKDIEAMDGPNDKK